MVDIKCDVGVEVDVDLDVDVDVDGDVNVGIDVDVDPGSRIPPGACQPKFKVAWSLRIFRKVLNYLV